MIFFLGTLTTLALAGAITEKEKSNEMSAMFWGILVLGLSALMVIAWHIGAHID